MRLAVIILTIIALMPIAAYAKGLAVVAAEVTRQRNGLFHYKYTVTNNRHAKLCIVEFLIKLSAESTVQSIAGPVGWRQNHYAMTDTVIWENTEVTSYNPILPGNAAEFSFDSPSPPQSNEYELGGLGLNEDLNAELVKSVGHIASPGNSRPRQR